MLKLRFAAYETALQNAAISRLESRGWALTNISGTSIHVLTFRRLGPAVLNKQ